MLALRHEARALARLVQLTQCPASSTAAAAATAARGSCGSGAGGSAAPAWLHATVRHAWGMGRGGEDTGSKGGGGGGITGWLTSKLPAMLGGDKIEDLDIETFGTSLKRARQLGGLTGFVHGTPAINDGQAQGTLRLFEQIIDAMRPEEKQDLKLFDAAARQRVAAEVGATTRQVDDCIARYLWTRQMTLKLAQLKKEGKPMPTSMDEVDSMLGSWRQYKSEAEGGSEGGVPWDHIGFKGQRCGLAGQPVARNTKCPLTRKAFKACCGKTLRIGGS